MGSSSSLQRAATETAPSPAGLADRLGSLDWPDDASSIAAVFAALPDTLAGLAVSGRQTDPDPSARGPQGDGFVVTYGPDDSGQSIEIIADPGPGFASPAHGIASTLLYSGGPQKCSDADHSPVLDALFTLQQDHDLQAELRRIADVEPVPGELVWLLCTMTYDGDRDLPLAEEDWRYLADWSDGGWLYTVRAGSALQRETAIATLADLSASRPDPIGRDLGLYPGLLP